MEVHPSAGRHGEADDDILHAVDHAVAVEDAGDDPERWLVIGPDKSGNLLEVIVMLMREGNTIAIHAMPLRPKYRRLLES